MDGKFRQSRTLKVSEWGDEIEVPAHALYLFYRVDSLAQTRVGICGAGLPPGYKLPGLSKALKPIPVFPALRAGRDLKRIRAVFRQLETQARCQSNQVDKTLADLFAFGLNIDFKSGC